MLEFILGAIVGNWVGKHVEIRTDVLDEIKNKIEEEIKNNVYILSSKSEFKNGVEYNPLQQKSNQSDS